MQPHRRQRKGMQLVRLEGIQIVGAAREAEGREVANAGHRKDEVARQLMNAASRAMFRSTGRSNAYRITATATSNAICSSSPEKPIRNSDSFAMMLAAVALASVGRTSRDLTKSSANMAATDREHAACTSLARACRRTSESAGNEP